MLCCLLNEQIIYRSHITVYVQYGADETKHEEVIAVLCNG